MVDLLAEKANFVTMHVVSTIVMNFILLSISDMTEFLWVLKKSEKGNINMGKDREELRVLLYGGECFTGN